MRISTWFYNRVSIKCRFRNLCLFKVLILIFCALFKNAKCSMKKTFFERPIVRSICIERYLFRRQKQFCFFLCFSEKYRHFRVWLIYLAIFSGSSEYYVLAVSFGPVVRSSFNIECESLCLY